MIEKLSYTLNYTQLHTVPRLWHRPVPSQEVVSSGICMQVKADIQYHRYVILDG